MRRLILLFAVAGCAQLGAPPGGPEDKSPPHLLRISPDTNALNVRPRSIELRFDEIINERPAAGGGDLSNLFLLSPRRGRVDVRWHRSRIEIRPRRGFVPNTTYTLTQVRGVADLRGRMPLANVKPRLRMTALYFVANSLNYLVAGTGNRAELTIGYFTKYGDGGVDLLPIGGLLKTEVRAMARELGVPQPIIDKPPSAGLWLGQTDEEEMGFTYAELERYLTVGPQAVAPALALRLERLIRSTEHKRAVAPAPKAAG